MPQKNSEYQRVKGKDAITCRIACAKRCMFMYCCCWVASRFWLCAAPWTVAPPNQAPLSMEFSRQEYWSRLPFPSPYLYVIEGVFKGSFESTCFSSVVILRVPLILVNFPGGSDGKESACSAGDPGSIPGLGRSPREGNGYPLQYSCLENCIGREA